MLSEERMAEIAGQFENDSWDWRDWEGMENPEGDPVYIQVPMTVVEVIRLDRRASEQGKTRTQLVRELLAV